MSRVVETKGPLSIGAEAELDAAPDDEAEGDADGDAEGDAEAAAEEEGSVLPICAIGGGPFTGDGGSDEP